MPKIDLKAVEAELEKGILWPAYWIYGPEKWKSRELLKKIRFKISGNEYESHTWGESVFDGSETDASQILDAFHSPSFFSGTKLIVIKDAHALKNPELLQSLLGPPQKVLDSVCIFISKDLDARKKFSKILVEKAAVIPCEEIPEDQRVQWIELFAAKKNIQLNASVIFQLSVLENWSLDLIEQEVEKRVLFNPDEPSALSPHKESWPETFLNGFFTKNLKVTLPWISRFAEKQDESLPFLGLLNWNVKQMSSLISDREEKTRYAKINPYQAELFRRWITHWSLQDIIELQHDLSRIDFNLKQRPLQPLGLWTELVIRHCKE